MRSIRSAFCNLSRNSPMTDCNFHLNTDGLWQCSREGCRWIYPIKSDKPPRRNCPATITEEEKQQRQQAETQRQDEAKQAAAKLGITWADAKHYVQALLRWRAANYPTRTDEEVETCLAECTKPCEEYVNGRCRMCGCCVNRSRIAVVNKARMRTEDCPLGKWPKSKCRGEV